MTNHKRFPLYPAVDSALVTTNALFGIDITKPKFPSDEDREIADNFDITKELENAITARKIAKEQYKQDYKCFLCGKHIHQTGHSSGCPSTQ